MLDFMFATPKSTFLRRTASFGVFCIKKIPGALAVATSELQEPKKTNTYWCEFGAQSHACAETKPLKPKPNFYDSRVRGLSVVGGSNFGLLH